MTIDKTAGPSAAKRRLSHAQVVEIAGQVDDIMAARIIETGATAEDLEEAVAWAAGESDVMGSERKRANTVVHSLYNILTAERKFPDDRD